MDISYGVVIVWLPIITPNAFLSIPFDALPVFCFYIPAEMSYIIRVFI